MNAGRCSVVYYCWRIAEHQLRLSFWWYIGGCGNRQLVRQVGGSVFY